MTFRPGRTICFRCLMGGVPEPGSGETCDTAGVLGPAVNVIASLQSLDAIKLLSGRGEAIEPVLMVVDLWEGSFRRLKVGTPEAAERCSGCTRGERPWLHGQQAARSAVLCGRNAVQITPPQRMQVSLVELESRLTPSGRVTRNPFLLKLETSDGQFQLTVFGDGRAIVQGTEDPASRAESTPDTSGCDPCVCFRLPSPPGEGLGVRVVDQRQQRPNTSSLLSQSTPRSDGLESPSYENPCLGTAILFPLPVSLGIESPTRQSGTGCLGGVDDEGCNHSSVTAQRTLHRGLGSRPVARARGRPHAQATRAADPADSALDPVVRTQSLLRSSALPWLWVRVWKQLGFTVGTTALGLDFGYQSNLWGWGGTSFTSISYGTPGLTVGYYARSAGSMVMGMGTILTAGSDMDRPLPPSTPPQSPSCRCHNGSGMSRALIATVTGAQDSDQDAPDTDPAFDS